MAIDPEMQFEEAMRLWFGGGAWGIANTAHDTAARNKWLRKWIKLLTKEVEQLETDALHKDRLMILVDDFEQSFRKAENATWSQIFSLINLIGALMGHLDFNGMQSRTLVYAYEDFFHYLDSGENCPSIGRFRDLPTILKARLEVVKYLEGSGLAQWRIAQVLNTSVHAIKRLKAELKPPN